jgi:glycosyltransferase involved in cell wall biosynthesis
MPLFKASVNMNTPQFSILIPTRDRPVTFRHALDSVVSQTGSFEIVVADNCSSPAVKLIAEEYANRCPNIKYLRSDTILPMSENWENGLRHCEGEYVTVLGDDDALLPLPHWNS